MIDIAITLASTQFAVGFSVGVCFTVMCFAVEAVVKDLRSGK